MRFPAVCRLAARGGRTSSVSAPHQGAGSLNLSTGGGRSTVACSEPAGGNGTGCGAAIGADVWARQEGNPSAGVGADSASLDATAGEGKPDITVGDRCGGIGTGETIAGITP